MPAAVRAATNGVGADIVLDPQGTVLLDTDLAVTAPGGRIVLFGNAGGGQPAALPPFGRLLGGNLAIGGFSITGLWANAPHRASAGLRRVLDLIADGRLDIAITEVGSLAETPARAAAAGRGPGPRQVRHPGQRLIPGPVASRRQRRRPQRAQFARATARPATAQ